MTRGNFNFQMVQEYRDNINFTALGITKTVVLTQDTSKILIEEEKIDEMIQTLGTCKKWLSSQ